MKKCAIAIHCGAGSSSAFLKKHLTESEDGMAEALKKAHRVLMRGGSAILAVKTAVMVLEDNPLFNAGCGSVLNEAGEIEMDAAIMDGKTHKAGAVCMIRHVKNPILLAQTIMNKSKHVLLSGYGALAFAKQQKLPLEPESYFITTHQLAAFKKGHASLGTVGAVALDLKGNLAAATSTGGTRHSLAGRIGDSCIIGAGCYANNQTCAISGTGEGEYLIRGVVAHRIAMLMECKGYTLQKACEVVIHKSFTNAKGKMGVIGIDTKGKISFSYNTPLMLRGSIDVNGKQFVNIF